MLTVPFSAMVVAVIFYHGHFGTFVIVMVAPLSIKKVVFLCGAISHSLVAIDHVVQY
jgi:hypothetical protein